jgi:CRISPR-associated endonuclease/helicase Cas3
MKDLLKPEDYKIIITIPFTSIIDQNFLVYHDILVNPDSEALLKHHHLAEPIYKKDEDELEYNKSQFLVETWHSQIIVTTFVQLIESFFTNEKSRLLKLPNISNSIIIMDEIQTIEYKYWELINNAFRIISRLYNCYFVLMTATQPLIFSPEDEIKEIVPDYKKYFKLFNRTKIINKSHKEISLDSYAELINKYIKKNPTKDILVILNTKKACRNVFEKVKIGISRDNTEIYYLTSLITPHERKIIINRIKDKKISKQKVIISTQIVEAGVDISVVTIFREIAPFDAIIQSAGRANRYYEKIKVSEVFLHKITDNLKGTETVYGSELIIKTENILKNISQITENKYLKLIEKYFKEVKLQADNIKSTELETLCMLNFGDLGEFKFIDERRCDSIFIQLNQNAKEIWDEYVRIYSDDKTDKFKRKEKFSKIKSKFYDFVINVPIPFGKKDIQFDGEKEYGFYISYLDNPSRFYNYSEDDFSRNTGYSAMELCIF